MWLRSAQPTPSGLGNLDVGARQWRLILPKATHIEGRTAWKASLNDYHRESSIDWRTTARVIRFPISDFVGGSVSLSIGGSILMSAEAWTPYGTMGRPTFFPAATAFACPLR